MGLSGFDILTRMDVSSNLTSSKKCTCGRVVEGTGLIIHFRKNVTGSNPVRCILKNPYNFCFNFKALPTKVRMKYNFARLTFEDCFLTIETIFGEFSKKICSTPIP